jgi:hypothetical protein
MIDRPFDGERGGTRIGCYQYRYTETWTGVIIVFFAAQEWDFVSMKPVGGREAFLSGTSLNLFKRLVLMKNHGYGGGESI